MFQRVLKFRKNFHFIERKKLCKCKLSERLLNKLSKRLNWSQKKSFYPCFIEHCTLFQIWCTINTFVIQFFLVCYDFIEFIANHFEQSRISLTMILQIVKVSHQNQADPLVAPAFSNSSITVWANIQIILNNYVANFFTKLTLFIPS